MSSGSSSDDKVGTGPGFPFKVQIGTGTTSGAYRATLGVTSLYVEVVQGDPSKTYAWTRGGDGVPWVPVFPNNEESRWAESGEPFQWKIQASGGAVFNFYIGEFDPPGPA